MRRTGVALARLAVTQGGTPCPLATDRVMTVVRVPRPAANVDLVVEYAITPKSEPSPARKRAFSQVAAGNA